MEGNSTTLRPEVILQYGDTVVRRIAYVPHYELIAVCASKEVYIYDISTAGEPIRVLRDHKHIFIRVIHLTDDILATVSFGGTLMTWRAGTGAMLDQLNVSKDSCEITKSSETEIIVGTSRGEIIIAGHDNGNNLRVKKRCTREDKNFIWDISAYGDLFVVAGVSNVGIWQVSNGENLHSIKRNMITSVAISANFIVLGASEGNIYVHDVRDGYTLLKTIDLPDYRRTISHISFLNADIIMATTNVGISFVSLKSGQWTSHLRVEKFGIGWCASVLRDGRICASARTGYCALFQVPQEVRGYVSEYTQRMYSPLFATIPFFSPALMSAFHGIQDGSFSVRNALKLATHSLFSRKSIQEWTYAHLIVMAAVRAGVVPRERKYKKDQEYWWNNLYDKASSLEMGADDMNLVSKFIKEAEVTGIIDRSCAEVFKKDIKKKSKSEINLLSTTIVDLYCRQIALDENVEDVLNCEKIQQRVEIVTAILACIPLAGGVAGQVLSGGMAFLENADGEDFGISGLVESLLGKGKDWSSFVTAPAVRRFLRAGTIVLEEETWEGIPEVYRLGVEAGAEGLGLSIGDLRLRLASSDLNEALSEKTGGKSACTSNDDGSSNVGTVVVDVTAASVGSVSADEKPEPGQRDDGIAKLNQEDEGAVSTAVGDIWKKMEAIERRNKDQREAIVKLQSEMQEEKAKQRDEMELQLEVLERQNKPLEPHISEERKK